MFDLADNSSPQLLSSVAVNLRNINTTIASEARTGLFTQPVIAQLQRRQLYNAHCA